MGGCITPPTKKSKLPANAQGQQKKQISQTNNLDTTFNALNQSSNPINNNINSKQAQPVLVKPKFKKMLGSQLTRMYRIQENVGTTTRVEGPKYVSNHADGTGKILRVVPFSMHSSILQASTNNMNAMQTEDRVKIFGELLGLEIYQDQQNNLLVMQEYYCGPYLHELSIQQDQQQIRKFLSQVHQIIEAFHQRNVVLGNLSVFSFRLASEFDQTVKLVQLNLNGGIQEAMGHAFKAQKSLDWQSFAFILQSVLINQSPIFIPHKIQYIQNSNPTNGSNSAVSTLLKGKKIKREELDNQKYIKTDQNLITGYRFRSDINKLLKLRKRRHHHRTLYYSQDCKSQNQYQSRNNKQHQYENQNKHQSKLSDQILQRMETNRVIERIESYAGKINPQCQQAFLMYCTFNQSLKKLKAVFSINNAQKKIEQFRQTLPLIK